MAKKVKGFMSDDGSFFETKADAEYHDAKSILGGLLLADWENGDLVLQFIERNVEDVERYIRAVQARRIVGKEREEEARYQEEVQAAFQGDGEKGSPSAWVEDESGDAATGQPKGDTHSSDNGSGEERASPVLEQPPRVTEHLPNLGRSVSAEEIRNQRTKHGTRSRKRHA